MNKKFLCFIIFFNIFISFNCFSTDYFVENNDEIEVILSKNNINRFKVFNDRIKSYRFNGNELKIDADKINGELYILPNTSKSQIEFFVLTENQKTYKVLFNVKNNLVGQQIFLNKNDFTLGNYAHSDFIRREKLKLINENLYFDFDDEYEIATINLIRAMSSLAKLDEFSIINREEKNIYLLRYQKIIKVKWLYSYIKNDDSNISGEIAEVINVSDKKIEITEDMFMKRGITAIKLEKYELEPKETTKLFFVGGKL